MIRKAVLAPFLLGSRSSNREHLVAQLGNPTKPTWSVAFEGCSLHIGIQLRYSRDIICAIVVREGI